ncbi:hypothetical protein [Francisella persica]|uniref:hypothetical protein n=1 Tax=Francisella persica TaxID=954 RepID=UPI000A49971A
MLQDSLSKTVLATDYLACKDSKTMVLIGTGVQTYFQTLAHKLIRPIQTVRYFDIDPQAMKNNMLYNMMMSILNL